MTSARGDSQPFLVAIRCPQCGAETDFPEGAHAIRCAYCGIVLRVVGVHRGGQARFLLLPTVEARALGALLHRWALEQGRSLTTVEWQTLLLVPYWRVRGIGLRWVYYRPAGLPAPAGAWAEARLLDRIREGSGAALLGSLGASVPGDPGRGAADGRDLQARHVDLSFPAFTAGDVGLPSLGVRTGVRPLRVLAPDVVPSGARVLPVDLDGDRALALASGRVASQFEDPPGHVVIERKAFVVASLSAVYFPVFAATVRLDGVERSLLLDAVAGSVVREADPAEAWVADLPARTPPRLTGGSVGFLPLKCPECAHDLPLETSAIAHFCVRCARAFAESGDRLVQVPYDAVPARGAAVYLPAWRFEATLTVDGVRLAGAADLPRLLKPVGWPLPPRDPDAATQPVSLYVPAFECRDLGLVNRLGAALTRLQPRVGGASGHDPIPLSPPPRVVGASILREDAEALARLLLAGLVPGAGPAARRRLESLEATLGAGRLLWSPVHDRGGYYQCRLTGVSLRAASLGWAPDGAGRPRR